MVQLPSLNKKYLVTLKIYSNKMKIIKAFAILDTSRPKARNLPAAGRLEMTLCVVSSSGLPAKGKEGCIENEGEPFYITK